MSHTGGSSNANAMEYSLYFVSLQDDFYLMCNNAMVYNAPETIYYKAAKKLLQTGVKLLSPVSLNFMEFFL